MCSTFPSDARVFREQQVSTVLCKTQEPSKVICMAHRLVILSDDCNLHQLCLPPFSSHFLSYLCFPCFMLADFFHNTTQMKKKPLRGGSFPCEELTKILRYMYVYSISPENRILTSIYSIP